ncbi:mannose-P-dolichol utilization defect 1 protein-like isoform X1 [Stigmatopora argus]
MAEYSLLQKESAFTDPFAGQLLEYFIPQRCSEAIFLHRHFLDGPCLRTALSKVAGGLVILGSMTVKLPQIAKILGAQNAEGVSFLSVLGELVAVTGSLAYGFANGFPFSAWGEALFVTLQTVTVGFLVQHYGGRTRAGVCFLLLYFAALAPLLSPLAPASLLTAIQASNVPAVVVSRVGEREKNARPEARPEARAAGAPHCFCRRSSAGRPGGRQPRQRTHGPVVGTHGGRAVRRVAGANLHLGAGNRRRLAGVHLRGVGALQRPDRGPGAVLLEVHPEVPARCRQKGNAAGKGRSCRRLDQGKLRPLLDWAPKEESKANGAK